MHRVVARKVHPSLLRVGKNYACTTKFPEVPYNETPVSYLCLHALMVDVCLVDLQHGQ